MTMSRAEKFQFLIKRLKSYQKTAPKLYDVKNKKTDSKFKINHYFDIFDKLSLEEGWTADYLYFQERIGGEPIIISYPQNKREEYAKKINKVYDNRGENKNKSGFPENFIEHFMNKEDVDSYLKHIKLDGSEESYVQFLILSILGSQFSLFWHAAYNDKEFTCTQEAAEKVIDRIGREGEDISTIENNIFDKESIKKIGEINFEPEIDIKKEKVVVRLVYFTKWGGFIAAKYSIKREFPHEIIQEEEKQLVEYNCGYVY